MRARKKDESNSARPSIGWAGCEEAGAAEGGFALDFDGFGGDRRDTERDTLCSAKDHGSAPRLRPGLRRKARSNRPTKMMVAWFLEG